MLSKFIISNLLRNIAVNSMKLLLRLNLALVAELRMFLISTRKREKKKKKKIKRIISLP
jgi:hypothetical protein